MSTWTEFLVVTVVSLAVLTVLQAATFAVGHRIGRYNVVDVSWGLGFVSVAAVAALLGSGDVERRLLLLVLVTVWGLRLTCTCTASRSGRVKTLATRRCSNVPATTLSAPSSGRSS